MQKTELVRIAHFNFAVPSGMQQLKVMPEDPPHTVVYGFHTNNAMSLVRIFPLAPKSAIPYYSPRNVIGGIHECLGEQQGLIEVKSGKTKAGRSYIYSIVKTLMPQEAGGGVGYTLCMDIDWTECAMHLQCDFQERGITGMRDSAVFELKIREGVVKLGDGAPQGWCEDPYDSGYTRGLLMNRSETREYDAMFPEHPLSVSRSFLQTICSHN